VPLGIDPTKKNGIIIVDHEDFLECFQDYQIAHYRNEQGYSDDWYDKENDKGREETYQVTVPRKDGDLYFTVETYFQGMVPSLCWGGEAPTVDFRVYRNSKKNLIKRLHYQEFWHKPILVEEGEYEAGDKFYVSV